MRSASVFTLTDYGSDQAAAVRQQLLDVYAEVYAAEETQAAVRRSEAAREQVEGEDEIGGLFACSLGRQEQYASSAHLRIGVYDAALAEANSALTHLQAQPVRAYGTEAQTSISRAMGHVGMGQPEAVMEVLLPVLQLRPEQRLGTVVGRMRDLTGMMAHAPGYRGAASVQGPGAGGTRGLVPGLRSAPPRHLARRHCRLTRSRA